MSVSSYVYGVYFAPMHGARNPKLKLRLYEVNGPAS